MSKQKIQKILIRFSSKLVDVVNALPLISAIKNAFVEVHISVLILKEMEGLFRNYPIDQFIIFEKDSKFFPILETGEDVISFLQKEEFDIGIICSKSYSSAYVLYQGGVKRRIGFARPLRSFMLTDPIDGSDFSDLLKPLKCKVDLWEPLVYAKTVKHSHLHIGISCSFQEQEQKSNWMEGLIHLMVEEIPFVKISLFGKGEDFIRAQKLIAGRNESIKNLCGSLEISNFIDKIHNFEVFVSDDVGLLAVAKACGTPVVDISTLQQKKQLFAEDFFNRIKEAILKPLKDRSSISSFSNYLPITEGTKELGANNFVDKKIGVIILAGGMGRRLGLVKPKGLLQLGDKCLYDILLEKGKGAKKIGILTSPITYLDTKNYCEGKDIDLFCKKVYPTESFDEVSPEGNGALFDAVVYSKFWDEWKNLDIISVIAVDNPLADPLDKDLILTGKDLAVIGLRRDKKEEKLGVLCRKGESLAVREYFTLGKDGMEGLGYSGSFAATPSFFEEVSKKKLPFYRVEKKEQTFYERLLIDGFIYAKSFDVIEKNRKDCFFPIKEKKDLFNYNKMMNIEGEDK
jgi:ADP-heptose:LPS heptosyltransferase